MHLAILGTGALACLFAARLAQHVELTMLGTWHDGLAALALDGVRVMEPDGRVTHRRVAVAGSPLGVPPAEAVLVLVKSYQTQRAAEWAASLLARSGVSLTLQNGLDNASRLAVVLGATRVGVGVTYNGATLLGPGEVRLAASRPTYIGPLAADPPDATLAVLESLVVLFNRAGLETHPDACVECRVWGKAVANAAINPLTALWRVTNGELLANPERTRLLRCLAREACDVAVARGIDLPFVDAAEQAEAVCRATATNRSSMLQDVERGRQTEIDSINGIIASEAVRLGVPAPHNELVWRLVRAL